MELSGFSGKALFTPAVSCPKIVRADTPKCRYGAFGSESQSKITVRERRVLHTFMPLIVGISLMSLCQICVNVEFDLQLPPLCGIGFNAWQAS